MSKGRILITTYVFPPGKGNVAMAVCEIARSLNLPERDIYVIARSQDLPTASFLPGMLPHHYHPGYAEKFRIH